MSTMLIDRVSAVVFHNGILRIDCVATGPEGIERPVGTLMIPGGQVAQVLQSLVGATQELGKRLQEQQQHVETVPAASP